MMPNWPSTLPDDLIAQQYRETLPDLVLEFATDVGPPRRRAVALDGPTEIRGQQLMTETQWQTLVAWWRDTLKAGALSFEWTHPTTGDPVWLGFTAPPQRSIRTGSLFDVQLSLQVE